MLHLFINYQIMEFPIFHLSPTHYSLEWSDCMVSFIHQELAKKRTRQRWSANVARIPHELCIIIILSWKCHKSLTTSYFQRKYKPGITMCMATSLVTDRQNMPTRTHTQRSRTTIVALEHVPRLSELIILIAILLHHHKYVVGSEIPLSIVYIWLMFDTVLS